ncbi:PqqD family protein [Nocardiopsis sp. JB363]|uniref:PqqD family protein n=1 Tax=Nocardiopsis sp. JB363 TaxID=1434837 RepID=UPI000979F133|nr:PqqD family protein [Nocardiopsis sp. JB363]SIO85550.1 hypothetical protein BQ8420_07520 [Nocardiopsis sp. JB363]
MAAPKPRPTGSEHVAADQDGAVLLHVPDGLLYGLNPTAAALWEHLTQGKESRDLVEILAVRWDVDPDRIQADTVALIEDLSRLGLLSPVEEER